MNVDDLARHSDEDDDVHADSNRFVDPTGKRQRFDKDRPCVEQSQSVRTHQRVDRGSECSATDC